MNQADTAGTETSLPSSFRFSLIAMALLLLAHLPLAVVHFRGLWHREHYQFFPFAFAAFAWLLNSRRMPGMFRWDHFSSVLVVLDVLCLAAALTVPKPSPLLAVAGMMLLLFAIARSFPDRDARTSLGYLIILPAISFRPPWNYDLTAVQWLQRVTTDVASQLLNFFGYLHLRAGNILEFPGKRFMVEEACSGVQSLFTLLFLAALIVCGYRRRWLHGLLVLSSAVCLAGVMNVLRVCAIAIAWDSAQVDLSTGWQHDALGYVALIVAGLLVLSADACFEFLFAPVPDLRGSGISTIYRNPFIRTWNWLFLRIPRGDSDVVAENHLPAPMISLAVAGIVCAVSLGMQILNWGRLH